MKQKGKYRIYVLGPISPELKERIAFIHASAILKSRGEGRTDQGLEDKIGKAGYRPAGRVKKVAQQNLS